MSPVPAHFYLSGVLGLASLAPSQFTVVNPPAAAAVEGAQHASYPFGAAWSGMRYQQICALSSVPMSAGLLKQIAFRRDNNSSVTSGNYSAWNPDLILSVSTAALAPAHMSRNFTANHGNDLAQVFSGTLSWPAQLKVAPGPTGFVYAIPFQTSFPYTNTLGDICYDIQRLASGPNGNTQFYMDAASEPITSQPQTVTTIGTGCSRPSGKNNVSFNDAWIPGSGSASVHLRNAPALISPLYWSVGITPNPAGFDLGIIGAPGCKLYHDNQVLVPGFTGGGTVGYTGNWVATFALPNNPAYAGFSIYSQFVLLDDNYIGNSARLSVSDAHRLTAGTYVPGVPFHSEAHTAVPGMPTVVVVRQGHGMVTEFSF